MVEFEGSLIVLAVSLLVGGLAIHLGATFALKSRNYTHAVVTAALGAVVWWLLGLAFADLEVSPGPLASLLALLVWVGVLKYRYDAGWLRAGLIGLFAWVAAVVVLALLGAVGVRGITPFGVP
jgi:hypothetical protein